jgi:tetratricopeptide (TPR) repeat protein
MAELNHLPEKPKRKPKTQATPDEPQWQNGFIILCISIVAGLLLNVPKEFWLGLACIVTFTVLVMLLLSIYLLPPMFWVVRALGRADYPTARRRAKLLNPYPLVGQLGLEGTVLLFAGHYDKAEEMLSRELSPQTDNTIKGGLLENLGCTLLRQGRYEEAIAVLEEAIAADPGLSAAYISLADAYLESGERPEIVLELTQNAIRIKRGLVSRFIDRFAWGFIYGDQAWAYALLGDDKAADQILQRAFEKANKKFIPGFAGLCYRAGRAMLALEDEVTAREYLEQAAQIDPRGAYGNLAARVLHDMTVWEADQIRGETSDPAATSAAND